MVSDSKSVTKYYLGLKVDWYRMQTPPPLKWKNRVSKLLQFMGYNWPTIVWGWFMSIEGYIEDGLCLFS